MSRNVQNAAQKINTARAAVGLLADYLPLPAGQLARRIVRRDFKLADYNRVAKVASSLRYRQVVYAVRQARGETGGLLNRAA